MTQRIAIVVYLLAALAVVAQDLPLTPVKQKVTNTVPGLSLTAPQTTAPGQRVAVVVAVADGGVKWEVVGGLSSNEVTGTKNLLVFFAGTPEVITVKAHSVSGGTATDTATTTITVAGAMDAKPPTPGKLVVKYHATFILPVALTDKLKELTADDFKVKLRAAGVEWHIRQGAKVEPEFVKVLADLGGIPAMAVSDADGNYLPEMSKGKITGVDDVWKILKVK